MVSSISCNKDTSYALPVAVKMLIGAAGIYGSFLYYGTLQEEVFAFIAKDGTMFKSVLFLQVLGLLFNCYSNYFYFPYSIYFLIFVCAINRGFGKRYCWGSWHGS